MWILQQIKISRLYTALKPIKIVNNIFPICLISRSLQNWADVTLKIHHEIANINENYSNKL